ncbi:RloB family protein [Sphingobacterium daejeonense]|uniref:RloB family protein n=1 Tax=Sphingobacterium daejeonense TaxID=371142 RepID=UPI0021A7247E|nr:RloB family protein [Sphingobacterium daejeonense]MCT1531319.1 RloB family protein [Sphingobacterium daejeonense]
MARKIKIPNERLKRFAREEQRRKKDIRNKRKYYLIVCEGEATEPNYFEGLKQDLPNGVLTAYQIDIAGTGRNTQSLVDEALRLQTVYEKNTTRKIDRLWVVFDKDSFTPQDFNGAIQRCHNSDVGCAWSNEAFELWYLLHFQYYENAISRRRYKEMIENHLKPILGNEFRYEKNSEQMYALLKEYGSLDNAIRNAKRLAERFDGRQDYANHNPCTMVYRLIEELTTLTIKD